MHVSAKCTFSAASFDERDEYVPSDLHTAEFEERVSTPGLVPVSKPVAIYSACICHTLKSKGYRLKMKFSAACLESIFVSHS